MEAKLGELESFWSDYVQAERKWVVARSTMDELTWIDEASDDLYDFSSLGTAPFEAAPEGYTGRPLYRYRRYEHPKLGTLYRVFTASDQPDDTWPSRQFIVTTKGGLQLMCEFETCSQCASSGVLAGSSCNECAGRGVLPRSPACSVFSSLGTFVDDTVVSASDALGDVADW